MCVVCMHACMQLSSSSSSVGFDGNFLSLKLYIYTHRYIRIAIQMARCIAICIARSGYA